MTTFKPTRKSAVAKQKALVVLDILAQTYPDAKCSLDFKNDFELLVATVLSAQTTDERVNQVTKPLFAKYPTPQELANANLEVVEEILHPIGFFRTKAIRIITLAEQLVKDFNSTVPSDMQSLTSLSGVGRKTANVVRGNAFGIPGLTIDTHIGRISRRLGWTRHEDPVKVEQDLAGLLPKERWTQSCHELIAHGRAICTARKTKCEICPLSAVCKTGVKTLKI